MNTEQKQQAIQEAEKYLKRASTTSIRTNKTYRGMNNGLKAARVIEGQFAEYASDAEKELASKFFDAYELGGISTVAHQARDWK